jgi:hypothetical protein
MQLEGKSIPVLFKILLIFQIGFVVKRRLSDFSISSSAWKTYSALSQKEDRLNPKKAIE